MDLYYNHIVDILTKNVGISRDELYIKSGIKSKWEFVREINRLLSEFRITKEYDLYRYSPRVLILAEIDEVNDCVARIINLNYLPNEVLRKELNYKNIRTEPEYGLDYELEITGYEISKEYKSFFEINNDISLNFDEFKYFLWAKYLFNEIQF